MPRREDLGRRGKVKSQFAVCWMGTAGAFRYCPWKGLRLVGWCPWTHYPELTFFDVLERSVMPRKPVGRVVKPPTKAGEPGKLLSKFPTLAAYLLDLVYEDDPEARREQSGMFLKFEAGSLHCWFSDPSAERQLKLSVPTLDDLFPALELALATPSTPWQDRPASAPRGGKKGTRK